MQPHQWGLGTLELRDEAEPQEVLQDDHGQRQVIGHTLEWKPANGAKSEANEDLVQDLRQQLDAALAELESTPETTTVPGRELLGKVVQIKVKGVVPDHYRDLAVDLGVHKGYPGYTVFEALSM